ncbi:heavy metal translocating P-type ATPase [Shewanella subflava]|uniref:Heavy metal translocating P-type ATPase metal-binding domain-containing protein n=1 Tax=Shewanella subflava TaxID=2986476 RepID=A0ABT3ICI9_9GAMM|nr:heavy metal translocating P-type ATPase metal-binding domain-containing protein [Shewanella subflava]MCW3173773.1 heavy metal translocating P-type ATPase metal-binding domain-containing protein [Shewanella subflava]
MTPCFHCNEPVLTGDKFSTTIDGQAQVMCCPGCQAVSQAIIDSGLSNYYRFRSEPGNRQTALVPDALNQFSAYDLPEVQQDLVHRQGDLDSISLTIDGITCAACAWLIEHKVKTLSGVTQIAVNSTTQRAMVSWQADTIALSTILKQISDIGYQAAPYQVDDQEKLSKSEGRKFLLRLGLAGFATMQVMMFAFALYSGYFTDLDVELRDYFRWVSMIFAAPVVFYSAQPFYFSAIRSLLSGKLNMDLSVSIAIAGAYIASCIATINGTGEVYFESVSMFTFFLLLGRYFEQQAKQKASVSSSNLHKLIPVTAHIIQDKQVVEIAAKKLKVDDIILVRPGDIVAADGDIISGLSSINESMLTGEQMPVTKQIGQKVFAGTINIDQPLEVRVKALGQDQLVAEIIRLQEFASNNKPNIALLADRLARYFSATILTIATLTYFIWLQISPDDAFWITLSVLVATCPCALALATPTAVTCATAIFTKLGIITRKSGVFEKLPQINHVVFDKTGTLTCGQLSLGSVQLFADINQETALSLVANLEQGSIHPIAQVFTPYSDKMLLVTNINHQVGKGVQGIYQQQIIKVGSLAFCLQNTDNLNIDPHSQHQHVYLSLADKLIASFELNDLIRPDSEQVIKALKDQSIMVSMATGDSSGHVKFLADKLHITDIHSGMSPESKLNLINSLQRDKHVAMFGDGINDAPVLAGANISVAMGSGSAIAKNSADLILLGDHLSRFNDAITVAKYTNKIIKQNLAWAFGYNVIILPLAVTGHVVPYIAAIGMSLSSIIVVSNSLRLLRLKL